ncbi:hypothetical protein [Helicobacter pylori]|uniref:hypothetical protein n=1 Tax=Helicobacter pylori TaxID=210 RepID=UPI001F03E6A7|nr:hypothetical protein [Helicobacter pylori]
MTLTERHIIRPTHPIFKRIKDFCHLSKNLYNYANFILREHYFAGFKLPTAYDLINRIALSKKAKEITKLCLPKAHNRY